MWTLVVVEETEGGARSSEAAGEEAVRGLVSGERERSCEKLADEGEKL